MKLQDLIDGYGIPVWGVDIDEDGEMILEDVDEGRFAARIAMRVLAADVRTGEGLCLIVVPDSALFAVPKSPESWWQRAARIFKEMWRELWD